MKLTFTVTKASVEKAMADLTVGERAMLFEGDYSVVSSRLLLSRFLYREDGTQMDPGAAKRALNGLSRAEFEEAIDDVATRMTDALVPPESASAS